MRATGSPPDLRSPRPREISPIFTPEVSQSGEPAADTLRVTEESNGPADSTRTAAAVDSSGVASQAAIAQVAARATDLAPPALYTWPRDVLVFNADRRAREVLEWRSPLLEMPSGMHFTPDPMDYGELPGRQPITSMVGGLPVAAPGFPGTAPDVVAPSWADSVRLMPPSPLYLPNNPSGGAILEWELLRPDTTVAVSGVKLSDGSNDSNADELYFARPSGDATFWLLWADHKSPGRTFFRDVGGQNLLVRYERPVRGARVSLTGQDHFDRVHLDLERRWLWNKNSWDLRVQGAPRGWDIDVASSASWHRLAWEGEPGSLTRKSTLYQTIARAAGPGNIWRPRFTAQIDLHRQRFWAPGRLSVDRWDTGLGLAAGVAGESNGRRWELSAGVSSPGQGRSVGVATLLGGWALRPGWRLDGYLARTARTRVLPHYANHLTAMVGQGFVVPSVDDDPELEVLHTAELRLQRGAGGRRVAWVARAVEIRNAVSGEDAAITAFVPEGYPFIPPSAYGQTLRALSGRLEVAWSMPAGVSVDAWGAARAADPSRESHLWMAPWEAQGTLRWARRWFNDDLDLELFARGRLEGERTTTVARAIDARVRMDAGATGTIGALYLYLMFVNVLDGLHEAAVLENEFAVMPLRSYRLGLAWRFLD